MATKDPEKRRAAARRFHERHPERRRQYQVKYVYGLSPAEYDELLAKQGGGCALCGKTPSHVFRVDHDHTTGKVRGLLCNSCNIALGMLEDDPELIERAAEYVRKNRP